MKNVTLTPFPNTKNMMSDGVEVESCLCNEKIKALKKELKEARAKIINYSNSYRALKRRFVMAQHLINGLRAINATEEEYYNKINGK